MALWRSWSSGLRFLSRKPYFAGHHEGNLLSQSPFSSKADAVESSVEKKRKKRNPSAAAEDGRQQPSSSKADHDSLLIRSLKRQLKEATKLTKKFPTEIRGSFKPFEIVSNDGASDLTLHRIIGKEKILVKCLLDLEYPDVEGSTDSADSDASVSDDVEELGILQRLTMNVVIFKNSSDEDQPRVAFLCSYAKSESVCIEDIAYFGGSIDKEYPYSGPYFPDLDSNLKQTFLTVIKTRGINSSLADTIMEHLSVQYQMEYLDWLKRLGDFLAR